MNPIKLILLLSVLVFIGCNNDKNTEDQTQNSKTEGHGENIYVSKAQFKNAKMEWGSVVEKTFAQTVHASGLIDVPPQSKAVISAFSGGYIKDTPLLIGDKVEKGERLVTLENPQFINMQQKYLETTEQLSYLKSEYERQRTMLEENITSKKSFLKAESDYKIAMAQSNSLKKNLQMLNINPVSVREGNIVSRANIYSPIDGYVTEVMVNTGTYVSSADKIMEIMNTDHIHLELKVFERDLLQVKEGQEILFRIPETSEEIFNGEVHLVGTSIDSKGRMAKIHGHIDEEKERNFSVGMFMEADIVTRTSKHLALPEDAIVEFEGGDYVLLLESEDADGFELEPMEVEIEANYKGFTRIKTLLDPNTRFLAKGGFVLLQSEGGGGH